MQRKWLSLLMLIALASGGSGTARAQNVCSTVVASGLVQPRFVAVGDDGSVYVSEAGSGGAEALPLPTNADPGDAPPTRGLTGQVTRISADGTKTVAATGLPSYRSDEDSDGPAGLVFANGSLWLAIGGPGGSTSQVAPLANEGRVVQIDPRSGAVSPIADLLSYEKAKNPDANAVESNLYGLAVGADGTLYSADAGGNTLYRVAPHDGELSVAAVFPGLPITREDFPAGMIKPDEPVENPDRGNKPEIDSVPTGVAVGPDGNVYVSILTGFPFPPGQAKVFRLSPDGVVAEAASGLTMPVSITFGPDKQLYVSQITTSITFNSEHQPPTVKPGNVVRVLPDRTTQVVADGLNFPNGISFDQAGNLYVVVNSASPPDAPSPGLAAGQLLRCDGVARPTPA